MAVDLAGNFPSQAVQSPRLIDGDFKYDLNTKERLDLELDPKVHRLERVARGAPILALTNRMGAPKRMRHPVFYMFQLSNLPNFLTLSGGDASANATITVGTADLKYLKIGYHLLVVRTREILRINSTVATSLPVTRSVGGVATAATLTGDEIVILGYRSAEGDSRFEGVLRQPTMIFNYNGELQDSYEITQIQEPAPYKGGGSTRSDARMDKLEQMRYVYEKAAIFDQRAKFLNEDGRMVYVPNGLDAICTENEWDFLGSMSEAKILAASESVGRYGPSVRWVLCSPRFMRMINNLFTGERRQKENITFAGVDVTRYQAGNLTLNFFPHLMLQDSSKTDATALSGTAYVCNFERGGDAHGFVPTTMSGTINGFFRWFLNLQTDGTRKVIDQLVVNYGFSYTFAEHFSRWVNPGS